MIMRRSTGLGCLVLAAFLALSLAADKDKKDSEKDRKGKKLPHPDATATWKMLDSTNSGKVLVSAINGIGVTPAAKTLGMTIHPTTLMIHIDSNLDGHISEREFHRWFKDSKKLKDRVEGDWEKADISPKDGFLTQTEYLASKMSKHARRNGGKHAPQREYAHMDPKNTSKINKEQFLWYTSPDDFGSADMNKDGMLTWEEYIHAPFHFHDYDHPSEKRLSKEFKNNDLNNDQKISLDEFNAELRKARQEDLVEHGEEDERDEDDDDDDDDDDDEDVDDEDDEREKRRRKSRRPRNIKQKTVKPLK